MDHDFRSEQGANLHSLAGLVLASVLLAISLALWRAYWKKNRLPLPPGPPAEPLLGHYRLIPDEAPFKQYAQWAEDYNSDVLFFWTFGTKWIVLNSLEAAVELLDRRGSNYADRPRFVMFEESESPRREAVLPAIAIVKTKNKKCLAQTMH
jgi:hypothetical protein